MSCDVFERIAHIETVVLRLSHLGALLSSNPFRKENVNLLTRRTRGDLRVCSSEPPQTVAALHDPECLGTEEMTEIWSVVPRTLRIDAQQVPF
jgi:hypothetical protein